MTQTPFVSGRAAPTTSSCTGSGDNAPRKRCPQIYGADWFSRDAGSCRLTRNMYEPTPRHMGEAIQIVKYGSAAQYPSGIGHLCGRLETKPRSQVGAPLLSTLLRDLVRGSAQRLHEHQCDEDNADGRGGHGRTADNASGKDAYDVHRVSRSLLVPSDHFQYGLISDNSASRMHEPVIAAFHQELAQELGR